MAEALDPDTSMERVASAKYKKDALSDVISIINSLQQEQSEADLEREIDRTMKSDLCPEEISDYDFFLIARHFYELGINARKEE